MSSSFRYAATVAIVLFLSPLSEAAEPACAGVTPAETWAAAGQALSDEDLVRLASCVEPDSRRRLAFRLLSMAVQHVEMSSLSTAEEGTAEYAADQEAAREAVETFIEIQRKQGMPVTPEEVAAADREAVLSAIDYPQLIADLILFVESPFEPIEGVSRGAYFTAGSLGVELTGIEIDGETATAKANGPVTMVQVDERWYLLLPE